MFWNTRYTISCQLKYHTIRTRCCKTPHNPCSPTLAPGSHDVLYYLPFEFLVLGACDIFSQLCSLPSSLSSPLYSCLVLGACYVTQLLHLFPSSVQHSAPISVNLSLIVYHACSCFLLDKKENSFDMNIYI